MIHLKNEYTVFVDVDDTLVMWSASPKEKEEKGVRIVYPIQDKVFTDLIVPHKVHIEQIKKHKLRGHLIVVWSKGGSEWAKAAVKAVGLEDFVDVVMCKPSTVYDDLSVEEFMPKAQWFDNLE